MWARLLGLVLLFNFPFHALLRVCLANSEGFWVTLSVLPCWFTSPDTISFVSMCVLIPLFYANTFYPMFPSTRLYPALKISVFADGNTWLLDLALRISVWQINRYAFAGPGSKVHVCCSFLYPKFCKLGVKVAFYYGSTVASCKVNLVKFPFNWHNCPERLDDAFMLFILRF